MGTHVAPWKQLLFGAIEANSHLSHSSYVQLVCLFFLIFAEFFFIGRCCWCFCVCMFSGNDWFKWTAFESYRRIQVTQMPNFSVPVVKFWFVWCRLIGDLKRTVTGFKSTPIFAVVRS